MLLRGDTVLRSRIYLLTTLKSATMAGVRIGVCEQFSRLAVIKFFRVHRIVVSECEKLKDPIFGLQ